MIKTNRITLSGSAAAHKVCETYWRGYFEWERNRWSQVELLAVELCLIHLHFLFLHPSFPSVSFLSPWPEEVLLHWCPSIHPSKQKTCTHRQTHTHTRTQREADTQTDTPTTYPHTPTSLLHHMHTHSPPATPAEALGLSHLLPTQPISPPLPCPPTQHMQPLPWVRWQGHWPQPGPRDRGEGAHM